MDKEFQGKRALVTGAAAGFGREIATLLYKRGAQVIAFDKNEKGLENLQNELPYIETVLVDLRDWDATKKAVENSCPIDLLVNNAGIPSTTKLEDVTEEEFDNIININQKAVVNTTQTVIKDLLTRKVPGSIVNISSKAAKVGLPYHTLYCCTKASVDGFTRAAALDFGKFNIRINAVNPTVCLTSLGRKVWADPALSQPLLERIPLKRFAELSEIAEVVLFLLSDKSSMITGSSIAVDGGFLAC